MSGILGAPAHRSVNYQVIRDGTEVAPYPDRPATTRDVLSLKNVSFVSDARAPEAGSGVRPSAGAGKCQYTRILSGYDNGDIAMPVADEFVWLAEGRSGAL